MIELGTLYRGIAGEKLCLGNGDCHWHSQQGIAAPLKDGGPQMATLSLSLTLLWLTLFVSFLLMTAREPSYGKHMRPWTSHLTRRPMSTFRQLLHPGAAAECVDPANNCNVKDHPGGVYTVLRTIDGGRKLVELDTHINRLVTSAANKFGEDFSGEIARALQDGFLALVRAASASATPPGDRRYTVLVAQVDGTRGMFYALCSSVEIPAPPAAAEVDVQYLRRPDPQTKSVTWALQREEAERLKRP